jgi:hypothetical protein
MEEVASFQQIGHTTRSPATDELGYVQGDCTGLATPMRLLPQVVMSATFPIHIRYRLSTNSFNTETQRQCANHLENNVAPCNDLYLFGEIMYEGISWRTGDRRSPTRTRSLISNEPARGGLLSFQGDHPKNVMKMP